MTPFGELYIHIDGVEVLYNYSMREKSEPCKDVDGRYLIEVAFQPDGIMDHVIECVFKKVGDMRYTRSYEAGECLECQTWFGADPFYP